MSSTTLYRGDRPPPGVDAASSPEASLSREPHICPPFAPALLGGPRDPPSLRAASAQSRAGGGGAPGPLAWKAPRVPAVPGQGSGAPEPAQLGQPPSWDLRDSGFPKPTSRNLLLPARRGSPRAANAKPEGPRPPHGPLPRRLRCAQTCPGARGPGARDSRRWGASPRAWTELGSTRGALWPRSPHAPQVAGGGPAAAMPGAREAGGSCDPGRRGGLAGSDTCGDVLHN